jgi:hypothetical protein
MSVLSDLCAMSQANASTGRTAFEFVNTLFAEIIAALRRDPRTKAFTRFELELLLADAHRKAENKLFEQLRNRIHIEDAEDAVYRCLGDDL